MRLMLSQRELARFLNVAPFTILRWEGGESAPVGLAAVVLAALERASLTDRERARARVLANDAGTLVLAVLLKASKKQSGNARPSAGSGRKGRM